MLKCKKIIIKRTSLLPEPLTRFMTMNETVNKNATQKIGRWNGDSPNRRRMSNGEIPYKNASGQIWGSHRRSVSVFQVFSYMSSAASLNRCVELSKVMMPGGHVFVILTRSYICKARTLSIVIICLILPTSSEQILMI